MNLVLSFTEVVMLAFFAFVGGTAVGVVGGYLLRGKVGPYIEKFMGFFAKEKA